MLPLRSAVIASLRRSARVFGGSADHGFVQIVAGERCMAAACRPRRWFSSGMHKRDADDLQQVIQAMQTDLSEGTGVGFSECVVVAGVAMSTTSSDVMSARSKLLLDIIYLMGRSRVDILDNVSPLEFYRTMESISVFVHKTKNVEYTATAMLPFALKHAQALSQKADASPHDLKLFIHVVVYFYVNKHQNLKMKRALAAMTQQMQRILADDGLHSHILSSQMLLVFLLAEHGVERSADLEALIAQILLNLRKVVSADSLLHSRRRYLIHLPLFLEALMRYGYRDMDFMDFLAGVLCSCFRAVEKESFRMAPLRWINRIIFPYAWLSVSAANLANSAVDFLEERSDWKFFKYHQWDTVRLVWSLVCQGKRPPDKLQPLLQDFVTFYMLGRGNSHRDVHLLPQVMFVLPSPWPQHAGLIHRMSADLKFFSSTFIAPRIAALQPNLLTNVVFPHEGIALAVGIFSPSAGAFVPYPAGLPSPETIDNGVLTKFLCGNVGVVLLELRIEECLCVDSLEMAGPMHRRVWLLERKGWKVCSAPKDASAVAMIDIMRLTARSAILDAQSAML